MSQYIIKYRKLFGNILGFIIILASWQIIALVINNEIYLPKLNVIFSSIWELVKDDIFFKNIAVSIYRTLISYLICVGFVVLFSIVITRLDIVAYIYKPISAFIIAMPPMILVLLIMIWTSKALVPIILGVVITFPILFEQIIKTLSDTKNKTSNLVTVYDISFKDQLLKIYFPIIFFSMFKTFVPILLITFKMVIAGEVFAYPQYGIGAIIQYERMIFNIPRIYAWLFIIVILSYLLISIQSVLNRRVLRWEYE